MNLLTVGTVMAKRGLLTPPIAAHRSLLQLNALRVWGFGLAGELRQATQRAPKKTAIIDEQGELTYAELEQLADRIAVVLGKRGYQSGQRIALLARNHSLAVATMCGTSVRGLDVVLGNTGLGAPQMATVMGQQEVLAIIYDDEFEQAVSALDESIVRISESELRAEIEAVGEVARQPVPDHTGRTIILTSGTTGIPKGAARKTPGGFSVLVSIIDRIPVSAGDVVLISAPVFHTWGYAAMQFTLALHGTMILRRRFTPQDAQECLHRYQPDALFAIPVMLQRMMELPPEERAGKQSKNLKVVATSGSAFPSGFTTKFMDEYGDVLYNLYGSTEASWVCIATPEHMRREADTAGTPPLGTVVKIIDPDGAELPNGEQGRIFCGNEMVFEGYTNGVSKEFMEGLVSTGDVGHFEGELLFVDGREDDMIVSGGENVYPVEVESALADMPQVREVAVVGLPDPEYGQRLAAFVALNPGETLTVDEVKLHVKQTRARHCVPRDVVFLDELPRNATGKVLHRVLRQEHTPN